MKYLIIPIIIGLVLLGACKKNSDSAVPDTHGNLMFVNATQILNDQFNVKLDSIDFASNVAYKTSTGYKSFRAQRYNLMITAASNPTHVIFNQELFLRNNRYYTAFLGADSTKTLLTMIVTEDNLAVPAGQAKFRVIDFSQGFKPNGTPLGMDVYSDTFPRFFRGLTFPSQTDFVPITGDSTYTLNFRWTDSLKVLKLYKLPVQTGKVYTLVTAGYPLDSTKLDVLQVTHN
ncbi:DUF4397 domain-containing protein [Chitinophaga polysaccharea]|uniref:DUF4397 domain-containing protein n=1 Tax=Chitinophaga TaxID=79328 RepID=UPI0014553674|nr:MULTISPECIES: DUF4397 domain-containing protein [Chitinophaga]NLR60796.1 DUF4397 domain-containing protein [Chitinophaga polysaccharea]NLU94830.1 DUF4397 domain-containing protein [Chitinophaga sp. Ak27]